MESIAPNIEAVIKSNGHAITVLNQESTGFWRCVDSRNRLFTVHSNNLMPVPKLPNRFRESSFQRFAHVIGAALREYPGAIKVDPSPLAADSYKQPLRDAITSKAKWGWKSKAIDDDVFDAYHDKLVVISDAEGTVLIGSREGLQKQAKPYGYVESSARPDEVLVALADLEPVCLLLHRKALQPPPNFFIILSPTTPSPIPDLESRYDVVFAPHESVPNKYFLIGPLNLNIPPK